MQPTVGDGGLRPQAMAEPAVEAVHDIGCIGEVHRDRHGADGDGHALGSDDGAVKTVHVQRLGEEDEIRRARQGVEADERVPLIGKCRS